MNIAVLRWPERTGALLEKSFRRLNCVATLDSLDDTLPAEWIEEADELRIIVGSRVLFRVVTLEGLSGSELLEAAKNTAEPLLPLSFSELAVSSFEIAKEGRARSIAVCAVPRKTLEEIKAWAEKLSVDPASGNSTPLPMTWIGPTVAALKPEGDAALTGSGWAALSGKSRWRIMQSSRTGDEAASEISRALADGGSVENIAWSPSEPSREYEGAALSRGGGSWQTGALPLTGARKLLQGWPLAASFAALLILATSFGIRYHASVKRIAAADASIEESFATALPGVRMNSPREQLRSRLSLAQGIGDAMRDRIAKSGSALDVLAAVERSAPAGMAVINDLRITAKGFTVLGSATDIALVQSFAQSLSSLPNGDVMRVDEPEIRRTGAGMGIDFTLKGER